LKKVKADYRDTFKHRAFSHDEAFALYPRSCEQEVGHLLAMLNLLPGEILLDAPSAGGFLIRYLTVPVHLIAIDPSPELHELCSSRVAQSHCSPMTSLPLNGESIDAIACLAGLHHEPNPALVLSEFARVLRPGGRAVIAEVDAGTAVATFLNGYVHQFNSHGHQGDFVDHNFEQMLVRSGLHVERNELISYHWPFEDRLALGDCLKKMFGIDQATAKEVALAAERELMIDRLDGGWLGLRWSLRMFLLRKPSLNE